MRYYILFILRKTSEYGEIHHVYIDLLKDITHTKFVYNDTMVSIDSKTYIGIKSLETSNNNVIVGAYHRCSMFGTDDSVSGAHMVVCQ